MHFYIVPTSIGIVAATVAIIVCGLLGLKLIAVAFNGIVGHRRPHHMARQGRSSGRLVAVLAGSSVLAILVGIANFRSTVRSTSIPAVENADHDLHEAMQDLSQAREEIHEAVREAVQTVAAAIPVDLTKDETSGITTDVDTTEAATSTDTSAAEPDMKTRREQLALLATTIGQLVRSRLEQPGQQQIADSADTSTKAADNEVVVFQLSEGVVEQLLGDSGRELLKSFNSELPESIRQTYALIPLTPPVASAVSPVQPLLAAGGLETIANSLVSLVDIAETRLDIQPGQTGTVVLATAPELRPMPDWVRKPDGRQIVAETEPILPGDDARKPLISAINRALTDHLFAATASIHPALREQTRFVALELSDATAQKCIVDTYERIEIIELAAGPKSIRKMYALLEFPEPVNDAAIHELRRSVQSDRIAGLGFVIVCVWLSVASSGFGIRLWRNGTRLRRWSSVPVFVAVSLPLLAVAAGSIVALSRGEAPRPPWSQNLDTVRIDLPDEV